MATQAFMQVKRDLSSMVLLAHWGYHHHVKAFHWILHCQSYNLLPMTIRLVGLLEPGICFYYPFISLLRNSSSCNNVSTQVVDTRNWAIACLDISQTNSHDMLHQFCHETSTWPFMCWICLENIYLGVYNSLTTRGLLAYRAPLLIIQIMTTKLQNTAKWLKTW